MMEWVSAIRKYWWIIVLVFLGFLVVDEKNSHDVELVATESLTVDEGSEEPKTEEKKEVVFVDVKGAVKRPGVYQLTLSDRTLQAIEKAGGFLKDADVNRVNLAAKVTDGTVIYVPKIGEKIEGVSTIVSETTRDTKKVNINTATAEQLETLDGIGPSKASAIVAYREENGPFSSIEELKNVSGIGEKSFEKIKNDISVQ